MQRFLKTRIHVLGFLALVMLAARGDEWDTLDRWPEHEFDFARLVYDMNPYGSGRGGPFTDYPEAETFFSLGVSRLTRLDMGREGVNFPLDDDSLFNYPWLYAVEVGDWLLNERDAERLREYLLRGGFLMVDDFHGTRQYVDFLDSMTRVFPDRPIVDIEDSHEILHVVYDVDERIHIPGIVSVGCIAGLGGRRDLEFPYESDTQEPIWRGIYDDDGRLMVIINHNMDLGDAWEHADDPCYPQEMTTLALHFAVNYSIYAMTH